MRIYEICSIPKIFEITVMTLRFCIHLRIMWRNGAEHLSFRSNYFFCQVSELLRKRNARTYICSDGLERKCCVRSILLSRILTSKMAIILRVKERNVIKTRLKQEASHQKKYNIYFILENSGIFFLC